MPNTQRFTIDISSGMFGGYPSKISLGRPAVCRPIGTNARPLVPASARVID